MPEDAAIILVVDDEPMVLGVVGTALELAGYTVLKAKDGDEALGICQTEGQQIDLAILDCFTPGMSGPDLFRFLRARYPEVKVIFMSGYSENLLQALQHDPSFAKATEMLPKPFLPSQLIAVVKSALARQPEPQ